MCSFPEQHALGRDEEEVMTKNHGLLVKSMEDQPILDIMMEEEVITYNGLDRIAALSTREERVRAILSKLSRHPKGYSTLLKALESDDSGQKWLAKRLRGYMDKLRQDID